MKRTTAVVLAIGLTIGHATTSAGQEIRVLASNGVKAALDELAPGFEQETGYRLVLSFNASNFIAPQIERGDAFDVTILTPALIDVLIRKGKVANASSVTIARVGLGVAVKHGAPRPDIRTVEAFRQALLNAKAVAYTTAGQSGQHFVGVIAGLGISDQVKPKSRTIPAGDAAALIVDGTADMAIQLISELGAVRGVDVIGPFPPELQSYVVFTGGIGASSANRQGARALLKFLTTPAAGAIMKRKGMEPSWTQ